MSDLQVMLTTNGFLLSVTADVKTPTGVQIIAHYPVAIAQSLPLLAFAQTADATSKESFLPTHSRKFVSSKAKAVARAH